MCQSLCNFALGFRLSGLQRHFGYELAFAFSSCPPETWKISTGQRCSNKRRKKR